MTRVEKRSFVSDEVVYMSRYKAKKTQEKGEEFAPKVISNLSIFAAFKDGYSIKSIAEALDIEEAEVRSRLALFEVV